MANNVNLQYQKSVNATIRWITGIALGFLLIILLTLFAGPSYRVYKNTMRGKADLEEARYNRKIQIEEAEANLEAQAFNAQAEVVRATGMAEAIEIENGKLTREYIHYLWVRNIDKMDGEKIYIPTEANMPILEARN